MRMRNEPTKSAACSRREFLGGALAAGAGAILPRMSARAEEGKSLKIARVETFPVSYKTVGRFKFFEDAMGRPTGRPTVVVKITADDGTQGWGQSVPTPRWSYETLESVQTTIERHLAPVLIGRDALDIDGAHAAMNRAIAPSFSTGQPICKAGIDLALWDLAARASGRSVADRWGLRGIRDITMSWTLNPVKLDDIEPLIEEGRRAGYRNFNVKVAPDPKFDIELCRRVKKAAPDGFLWADANGGYDLATALEVIPKLADAGVEVLEQPLPANRLTGYRDIRKLKALPILMDEGLVSSAELEEFIDLPMRTYSSGMQARLKFAIAASKQQEILIIDEALSVLSLIHI